MTRILVTGAAGFIGSNFVDHLLASVETDRVMGLDVLSYAGRPENLDAAARARSACHNDAPRSVSSPKVRQPPCRGA